MMDRRIDSDVLSADGAGFRQTCAAGRQPLPEQPSDVDDLV